MEGNDEEDEISFKMKKRDAKFMDKRDQAIERV